MLFQPILALDIMNFLSWQNYWGGGGGGKRYVCPPPNIFIGGGATGPPPPPRIDASDDKVKGHLRSNC